MQLYCVIRLVSAALLCYKVGEGSFTVLGDDC